MKHHGLDEMELVKVYCSVLRSCLEFASPVYGPMLTGELSEELEKLQRRALKIIFGFDQSYRTILEKTGIGTLEERRKVAIEKFAQKTAAGNYHHWFPKNGIGRTRNALEYKEDYARTDRLRKTPIFHMRRVLNGREV